MSPPLARAMFLPPISLTPPGSAPSAAPAPPHLAPVPNPAARLTAADAIAMTPQALARATQLRMQQVLGRTVETLARLEGELFRALGQAGGSAPARAEAAAPPAPGNPIAPPASGAPPASPALPLPLPDAGLPVPGVRPGLNIPQGLGEAPAAPSQPAAPAAPAAPTAPAAGAPAAPPVPELAARAIELIARLAKVDPQAAEALLARHQALHAAFPATRQQLIGQLGQRTEAALAEFVRQLVQPSGNPARPAAVPTLLASVFSDPAQMAILLKRSAKIADLVRTGGSPTFNPAQGRTAVPPARNTMDGLLTAPRVGAPVSAPLPQTHIASNPLVPAEALFQAVTSQVNATVDTVTLSRAGQTQTAVSVDVTSALLSRQGQSASQVGVNVNVGVQTAGGQTQVGVLVNVNQILATALGEGNPLGLSETQIQIGIEILQGQAARGPQDAGVNPLLSRVARSFADMLVSLRQENPEAFEKLMTMLRSLAELNPGKFDRFLMNVESQLRQIVEFQRAMQQPGQPLNLPANAPAPGGGAAPAQGGTVSVLVDVDVSQRLDLIVQDLRGRGIDARALQSQSQIEINVQIGIGEQVQKGDPLIIDLEGDGVALTGRTQSFDIDGDGALERTAFVQGDDALLMLDANGDGRLTSGKELFGDQEGHADGFAKLAGFDDNADGVIDAKDKVFDQLRVVFDKNRDGATGLDEIAALREVGIESISLAREATGTVDAHGNELVEKSEVKRTDGTKTAAHEALFTFQR